MSEIPNFCCCCCCGSLVVAKIFKIATKQALKIAIYCHLNSQFLLQSRNLLISLSLCLLRGLSVNNDWLLLFIVILIGFDGCSVARWRQTRHSSLIRRRFRRVDNCGSAARNIPRLRLFPAAAWKRIPWKYLEIFSELITRNGTMCRLPLTRLTSFNCRHSHLNI